MHRLWPFCLIACASPHEGSSQQTRTATGTSASGTGATPGSASVEICDGIDNDGDGQVDEGLLITFFPDLDGDGWGNPDGAVEACDAPTDFVPNDGDCDDTQPLAWSFAEDHCDGVDNDCDGDLDEAWRSGWELGTLHNDGLIHIIDPVAGTITPRVALSGVAGIAINSADTRDTALSAAHDSAGKLILSFDACSGVLAEIMPTPYDGNLPGVAFGPNGLLYGLDVDGDRVLEIDLSTGSSRQLVAMGRDIGNAGLAFDCSTEKLWLADQVFGAVQSIDPYSGALGPLTSTAVPFGAVGVEYDHVNQVLLASTGTELYSIDPASGADTLLMSFGGITDVNDVAFLPPCP
jgi:hypothetical protein